MGETLRPCPFCGGEARVQYQGGFHSVRCKVPACAGEAGWGSEAKAIAAWNRRQVQEAGLHHMPPGRPGRPA
jgi:hypothetical protein